MTHLESELRTMILVVLKEDQRLGCTNKVTFTLPKDKCEQLEEYIEVPIDRDAFSKICINFDKGADKIFITVYSFDQPVFEREIGIEIKEEKK